MHRRRLAARAGASPKPAAKPRVVQAQQCKHYVEVLTGIKVIPCIGTGQQKLQTMSACAGPGVLGKHWPPPSCSDGSGTHGAFPSSQCPMHQPPGQLTACNKPLLWAPCSASCQRFREWSSRSRLHSCSMSHWIRLGEQHAIRSSNHYSTATLAPSPTPAAAAEPPP